MFRERSEPSRRHKKLRFVAVAAAAVAVVGLVPGLSATAAGPHTSAASDAGTYTNPVTQGYSIDFPDPSVIKAKDGYWYAYGTGGPYDETGRGDSYKIARSTDLVHWENMGPIFTADNIPKWAVSGYWAPDIRYINGKYIMYFVVPDTTFSSQGFDPGIGVATAASPAGPWKDALGKPLLGPIMENGGYTTVIDPSEFTDTDGKRYLYWGSYGSGIRVVPLSDDGMSVTGPATQVASTRFEGSYVIHRDGWYYMFASSANCCAGPTTGYTVFVGRSKSPLGPFVDKEGVPLNQSNTGGTIVLAQNGNSFVGVGHNAIATDESGQTWIVYHGVPRDHPYFDSNPGYTMRPMLIDRLDWINGWPLARGGLGPSDTPQQAPITAATVADDFSTGNSLQPVSGSLSVRSGDPQSGNFGRLDNAAAVAGTQLSADQHVEADVRTTGDGAVGVLARYQDKRNNVAVTIDPKRRQLRVVSTVGGAAITRTADLPAGFDPTVWHNVAVDIRGTHVTAQVTDARLGDPYATVSAISPGHGRQAGVIGTGDVDNLAANVEYTAHTSVAPPPNVGKLDKADSDDFTKGLGAGWTWKNQNPDAVVKHGQLNWPTEDTDLSNASSADAAGLLLRDEPSGDYTVETRLTIDTGINTVRNFQQAGLVVYVNNDQFLRYDHVAAGTTRFLEFGKVTVQNGVRSWGAAIIGPPAATTWLRIKHWTNAAGEGLYRAGSSRDGKHWIWGAVWTLPAGSHPRIGLVSQGSNPTTDAQYGKANAQFDYFHIYK